MPLMTQEQWQRFLESQQPICPPECQVKHPERQHGSDDDAEVND
jgi:hypothetical protein